MNYLEAQVIASIDYIQARMENVEAELDCAEHFGVDLDSSEFAQITGRPF